ncbi:hypothetical protein [Edaphobacter modestus]|uniref:hypothetical protein n=1 Tax=Edaphobacter modestus TaxID=388466 RepID=UPI00102B3EE1|nr:hypothetical protein [Edaphobacter modestus]
MVNREPQSTLWSWPNQKLPGLKIGLSVEIAPQGGVSTQNLEEIKGALRELGLQDDPQGE